MYSGFVCPWQDLPNQTDKSDDDKGDYDSDSSDDERWFDHDFVIKPPLVRGVAINRADPRDSRPRTCAGFAPFVRLVAFFLAHLFYGSKKQYPRIDSGGIECSRLKARRSGQTRLASQQFAQVGACQGIAQTSNDSTDASEGKDITADACLWQLGDWCFTWFTFTACSHIGSIFLR